VFSEQVKYFQELFASGVVISPLLAGLDACDRFDPVVFEVLDLEAEEFAALNWLEKEIVANFGTMPVPDKFPKKAVYETAAATAVLLAHEQSGDTLVDEKTALDAFAKVKSFAENHGLGILILLYGTVTAYDNMNALAYYGKIPERTFLQGKWHRPWIDYPISDELVMGVLAGYYQILVEDGMRFVTLTEFGHRVYQEIGRTLEEAGYFKNRASLLHISQFNCFKDYEQMAREIWPESMPVRRHFLDWAGIKPGMRVLELGCGSGPFTFEGGLADRVGPEGRVIAVDPSSGMLARAKGKQGGKHLWVEFKQARAESLPFENKTFDAVIGVGFLQFTDHQSALREMSRVARPGGIVASFHPLQYDYDVPFFREWFRPIFDLAGKHGDAPKNFIMLTNDASKAFEAAGLSQIEIENFGFPMVFHDPEKIVKHFIRGVGLFQEELSDLPWKAREELLDVLKENGDRVCLKYPPENRIVYVPSQNVKGLVP
jgi:ubiquinone/menaquinone biosynthesis C-methylase UbiE